MSGSPSNPIELAKQGNCQAIDFLINRQLTSKGIAAKSRLQGGCLRVVLESHEVPSKEKLAPFIHKGISALGIDGLNALEVYGRCKGLANFSWTEKFIFKVELNSQDEEKSELPESGKDHEKLSEPLELKTRSGTLIVENDKISIIRPGGLLSAHKKGSREIQYSEILGFQYAPPEGWASDGFFYFRLSEDDSPELGRGDALINKNAIKFDNLKEPEDKILAKIYRFLSSKIPLLKELQPLEEQVLEKILGENSEVLELKGMNGTLIVRNEKISIIRSGGFLSTHEKGLRDIPYSEIFGFQYAPPEGWLSDGFFYFRLSEDDEPEIVKDDALQHENAIKFDNNNINVEEPTKDKLLSSINRFLSSKISSRPTDNFFLGDKASLTLKEKTILIRCNRSSNLWKFGEKSIPYENITAVQLAKSQGAPGFIQFTIQGGVESVNPLFDENAVVFSGKEKNAEFERAKAMIEERMQQSRQPASVSSNVSNLDDLEKLASLRDKGIITEEEFQAKKKQILGI